MPSGIIFLWDRLVKVSMRKATLILLILCIAFFVSEGIAYAVIRTWGGGSGVVDGNWNTATNWTGDTVPGSDDTARFDNTSDTNCTINAAVDVNKINIAAGYNGIVSQGANAITVGSGGFVYAGGTGSEFNGGSADITVSGDVTLSGASFISTSATLDVSGDFSATGLGTFDHGDGTIQFSGGVKSLTSAGVVVFNNFTLNKNFATTDLDLKDALDVDGTLTITKGNLDAADSNVNINLQKSLSIASNGNFTKGTGTFILDGNTAGTLTDTDGTENLGNVQIGTGSSKTITLGSDIVADNITISASATLNNSNDSGTTTYNIDCQGNWSNSGTFTHNSSSRVRFNGTTAQTVTSGSSSFNNFNINNTGATDTVTLQDALDVDNGLTIVDGTLVCNNQNINIGTNLDVQASGVFTKGTGTLTFDGSGSRTWTDSTSSGQDFGNVTIGDGTNSKTITLASAVIVDNLTISASATLDVDSTNNYGITSSGNWSTSGTFNERQGTVTFDGSSKNIGAETFYGLTITGTLSSTGNISCANFTNSGTFTVGSSYTLTSSSSGTYSNTGTITENGKIILAANSVKITDANGTELATITTDTDIYVTLTDYDENLDGTSKDTATGITVSTSKDSEAISLTETGNSTGIFRNGSALPYAEYDGSATANDGTLEGSNSATITVTYTDSEDSTDNSASDTATGQAFTTGFTVTATTPQVAGSNFTLTVTAIKSGGSTSTSYTGTVNLSVNYVSPTTGTKTLSTTSTSSFTNGVASVSLNYPDCGTMTITATDSSDSSKTGTSGNIVFVPYDFTVVPNSTTQTVNKNFTLTITARNASAVTCANYQGTATVSASTAACSTTGTFSPTTSLTSSYWSSGVATLTDAKFNKYGSITFTAKDNTVTTRSGTSSSITFYPKDFSLSISDPPASRTFYYKNETFDLTVTARDNDGATISNYNGKVNISASGISGLSSTYTFTCSDSGSHKFSGVYGGSETTVANVTITDSGNSSSSGSLSEDITIKEATLKVSDKSGPVGTNAVTVAIYDSDDEIITEDDSTEFTVALSESNDDDSASSDTTTTAQTLTSGQATIYITDNQAETVTIAPSISSPSSADIDIESGTLTIGTLTGAGVGIEMWREIKENEGR